MTRRGRGLRAVIAGAALVVTGCGGHHRRPAAEPALSPPTTVAPAGASVPVGVRPQGIVADPRTGLVAVAVRDPTRIVLLRAATARVVGRVAIPGSPRHLQLARLGWARSTLLVPEELNDRLLELALPSGAARSVAVGSNPHDAAFAAGRVFVAIEHGESVWVISGQQVIRRIAGFVQPGGVAAVSGGVAVVDVGADTVTLLDAHTLRVTGRLSAGAGPSHAVGDGDRLYVVDTRGDAVLTYATQPRLRLLGRTRVPGTPYGIADDRARGRLWVTETATNRLALLDTRRTVPRVLRSYPTGRQPDTVAVDPADGRVFIADAAAGTVQVLDAPAP